MDKRCVPDCHMGMVLLRLKNIIAEFPVEVRIDVLGRGRPKRLACAASGEQEFTYRSQPEAATGRARERVGDIFMSLGA